MKSYRLLVPILSFIGLLFLVGLVFWWYAQKSLRAELTMTTSSVVFVVEEGMDRDGVIDKLAGFDLVENATFLKFVSRMGDAYQSDPQPGRYILLQGTQFNEAYATFVAGEIDPDEYTLTFLEGWTTEQMAEYVADVTEITAEDFLYEVSRDSWMQDYEFLASKPLNATLEGFLFPDTYRVFKDATAADVVRVMLDNFDQKLSAQMRADIVAQEKTVYEIVTLASIVERELRGAVDKAIGAGVFWNRLEIGQPLESDATVNYVTDAGRPRPTFQDLQTSSPYNTYQNPGLPPGPISNPGLESLTATIYPEETDFYYFLTTLDTGVAIFAKTFEEHLANVAEYLD